MVNMSNLDNTENLKGSGIIVPAEVEKAMYKVEIEDFTEHDSSGFYYDRPVVFWKPLKAESRQYLLHT